jgi:hypothetical protein
MIGATTADMDLFLSEAKTLMFCDISVTDNNNVTVRNRRMWREEKDRKNNRERQERFRGKRKNNNGITPPSSTPSPSPKKERKKEIVSDDQWLKTLEDNPIYEGIEVRACYGKMLVWCDNNGKKPTRRRFVNWLNREDKPLAQGKAMPATTPKGKPSQRCQKCEGMFYHLSRIRDMNVCPKCAELVT